jgi:hypothetical protein
MDKADHAAEQQGFNEKPKITEIKTPEARPQFPNNQRYNDAVLDARPAQNKSHLIRQIHH